MRAAAAAAATTTIANSYYSAIPTAMGELGTDSSTTSHPFTAIPSLRLSLIQNRYHLNTKTYISPHLKEQFQDAYKLRTQRHSCKQFFNNRANTHSAKH